MSTQPEALRLAEVLMHLPAADAKGHAYQSEAAAELRRLHEDCEDWKQGYALLFKENGNRRRLNEELVEALKNCLDWMESMRASGDSGNWEWNDDEYTKGVATLAKAETP
jgi:hypothetical protein